MGATNKSIYLHFVLTELRYLCRYLFVAVTISKCFLMM